MCHKAQTNPKAFCWSDKIIENSQPVQQTAFVSAEALLGSQLQSTRLKYVNGLE